ncbi:magnesium protoporphyrin IX methyltransferase [Aureimonas sp. SA4125]|uniref:magnesium protoporphyrin IX methyltransferase n=1 Tax=Aureimonas sp. SA4125 TaxID=2826993 RepID=UPI001CC373BF|nr:magnesium protoporphyrin IX methyltransferase [Aureimonas sp. SA4125]BDA85216.1 magnesium protoporphyrin IX methyltransferase [Aureimonas sp. SA4125]
MDVTTYQRRRGEIRTYFDETAVDAWKRFASEAPLGRIRASVRAGRALMRAEMLACLPDDLQGWRILDAGCGTGALAVELARRGADVLGIDIAPEIIRFAAETVPSDLGAGRITFRAGDMLDVGDGRFDAVTAMDSLIHYSAADAAAALATLAGRTQRSIVFTHAPQTPALSLMHAMGQLFPRANRSPQIVPTTQKNLLRHFAQAPTAAGWTAGRTARVAHGFYTSQCLELSRS